MSRADVVVLGEALVDVFDGEEVIGGAPFNVARTLAALGEPPLLVSRVGADARGARIWHSLAPLGMRGDAVQVDPTRPTGVVQVALAQGQPQFAIAAESAWDHLESPVVAGVVRAAAPRLLYFGTLAQRHPTSRSAIQAALQASDAVRVLDLNLRGQAGERECAAESLALADVLKVNADELAQLGAWFTDAGQPAAEAMAALIARFDLRQVVVTRGADGWASLSRDGALIEGPAPRVDVVDTVGAGDAFTAVLLIGELRGWPVATTLARAARLAAAVCTLRGGFEADSRIYARNRATWA